MNYLDELPDYWSKSKSLRRKKWLRVPAKNIQNKTKLFASFPTYCNQKQTKGQEDASWKLPTFYPGRCFRRACSQKSEYWSKCTCSGFATELTLQVTVIFSSPASSCSRSSPACALKPRVHRKPYTISRDPHAISEAHSCWAPPLHTLSPQEVNHLAKFKGLQAGVEAPAALALCHFRCPHGAPPFSNTEGGSSAILLQAPRGWSSLVKLFPSELLRDAGTTSISRSLRLQMNLWRELICMRPFITQIRERTNFQNTSPPVFVESWILFPMIYVGVLPKLLHEYILNYQLPHWTPGGGNGNPLQYSCLENSMDRGTWWAEVHGVAKSCP